MFRLPKSSYNRPFIVTFRNLRICAGLYSTLFLIVVPPRRVSNADFCFHFDNWPRLVGTRKHVLVRSRDTQKLGHGQSEGIRAHINTFDKFVEDAFYHIDLIRVKYPELDCFICGHSMGGAISILAALKKPTYFKGVVLIGPAIATNPEVTTPWKEIQKRIPSITFPFVIFQGEDDKLCAPEGAVLMYEKAVSEDKAIKIYPNAFHNLLNEPNGVAETVTKEILHWLCARS
ncbi:monoglyceride lipase [Trichonephila clavipes]|uniref:Monoglyceride lipase n=1 Tax=Trichonephila clavipes TaxID=2585209 RepID=A0A8X6S781_TRICX|nr:monoglyceride lipase [Trichonephila clavipes]